MLKFFRLPFATTGDKTAVPDAVDSNGNVSYSQGYGFDYQRPKTDPAAKNIERDKMNQVFFDMTTAIAELQSQGVPDFITTALNGGTAYSYGQYAIVKYSGDLYISLVAANTALPSDATKWALLPTPARIQGAYNIRASAGGTANALTGAFTPAIAALPGAPDTLLVLVRAGAANTTATPTFAADGTAAKTIVKGNNLPLLAGDIAGAGHWLELQYDPALDKWVLQNPAFGVSLIQGNFAGLNSSNVSATLALSDLGKLYAFYGSTAAQTLTLPALASIPVGKNVIIVNQASVAVTVKGNASENISSSIAGAGQSLSNTIVLNAGDSITLSANGGTQWNAYGFASPGQFPNSLAGNGYQKFPNGLILQWMSALVNASSSSRLTFPLAFGTVYTAVASHQQATGSGSIALGGDLNTTGVTAYNQFAGSVTVNVYALGE